MNQSSDLQFDQRQMNNPFNTIQDRSLIREGLQMPGFFYDMVMPVVETIQSGKSQLYCVNTVSRKCEYGVLEITSDTKVSRHELKTSDLTRLLYHM